MNTYIALIIVGTVLLIVSFAFTKDSIYLIRHGEKTISTITRVEEVANSKNHSSYYILSFTTINGKEKEFECHFPAALPTTYLGGEVPIVYDPHNPSDIKILTYFGAFAPAIIIGAFAAGFLFIGIGYFAAQIVLK
ncbi:DUF3592 domain-containing protein [Pinibacter soli]|uniref:DUF3592 domain-containing protein n=1 Tax=Pinibacter soli TaxID=3044211 RepID=A0ABT6REJ4_9BACT|nr:DUF3592 domain-containing protein [Pinibacter soli]MDI3320990.1 DUF3592 domain-containing protein [Pinibacter soli]